MTIELRPTTMADLPDIMGWVNDLTAQDPFFILPILNGAIMWLTQKMTPMVGMDPMQKKMMLLMPVVFTYLFLSFPSGLG